MFLKLKTILKPYILWLIVVFNFCKETMVFFILLVKHNASTKTDKTKRKMQFTLLRENHVIEKGMSMRDPRKGFGQEKVLKLMTRLELYNHLYDDTEFLLYPLSTIKSYCEFTKRNNVEIPEIEAKYENLLRQTDGCDIQIRAGIKEVSKDEIWKKSRINFQDFVNTRHSIRYLSSEPPAMELINRALAIAQRTPSACNRQAWCAYVFSNEKTYDLLKWQGGASGFERDIPLSILVTSNMNAFLYYEPHQAYVDGGMYAMSLIYALHSLGLGTIPFSMAFQAKKIKVMHRQFNIPESEVPIAIIGVGHLLDRFSVAVSERKPIGQTTVIKH